MIRFQNAAPLAIMALLAASGCSLILNWDRADLPCLGVNQACVNDYSCLQGKCAADGSQAIDEICVRDRQCADGALCPAGRCARACDLSQAYTASTCSPGHYCAPFVSNAGYTDDPNHAPPPKVVAVCVTGSSCSSGSQCADVPGGICTVIAGTGSGINACVVGCDISVGTDGNSTNNCSSELSYSRYCTPVGAYNYGQLACVTTGALGIKVKGEGQACNTAALPCDPAFGCMAGACRRYCTPTSTGQTLVCQPNEQCCSYYLSNTHLGQSQPPTGFCYPTAGSTGAAVGCPPLN